MAESYDDEWDNWRSWDCVDDRHDECGEDGCNCPCHSVKKTPQISEEAK